MGRGCDARVAGHRGLLAPLNLDESEARASSRVTDAPRLSALADPTAPLWAVFVGKGLWSSRRAKAPTKGSQTVGQAPSLIPGTAPALRRVNPSYSHKSPMSDSSFLFVLGLNLPQRAHNSWGITLGNQPKMCWGCRACSKNLESFRNISMMKTKVVENESKGINRLW